MTDNKDPSFASGFLSCNRCWNYPASYCNLSHASICSALCALTRACRFFISLCPASMTLQNGTAMCGADKKWVTPTCQLCWKKCYSVELPFWLIDLDFDAGVINRLFLDDKIGHECIFWSKSIIVVWLPFLWSAVNYSWGANIFCPSTNFPQRAILQSEICLSVLLAFYSYIRERLTLEFGCYLLDQ